MAPSDVDITQSSHAISPGLREIYYDNSTITDISGHRGMLYYCGYSILDLVKYSNFEEIAYLLLHRTLPQSAEFLEFKKVICSPPPLPSEIVQIMTLLKTFPPIEVLRTVISCIKHLSDKNVDQEDPLAVSLFLISSLPLILTTFHSIRSGLEPLSPDPRLSFVDNLYFMFFRTVPPVEISKILEEDLILHADHASCTSTFVARTITSTHTDIYSTITGALAALSGKIHGGSVELMIPMLKTIGSGKNVKEFIQQRKQAHLPICGFGHRVYKTLDPRAAWLHKTVTQFCQEKPESQWLEILEALAHEMSATHLFPNIDAYASLIYHKLNIPIDCFIPLFAISRIVGWVAHSLEQQTHHRLIRPRLQYVGSHNKKYLPMNMRE